MELRLLCLLTLIHQLHFKKIFPTIYSLLGSPEPSGSKFNSNHLKALLSIEEEEHSLKENKPFMGSLSASRLLFALSEIIFSCDLLYSGYNVYFSIFQCIYCNGVPYFYKCFFFTMVESFIYGNQSKRMTLQSCLILFSIKRESSKCVCCYCTLSFI